MKKKWKDKAEEAIEDYLEMMREEVLPLFEQKTDIEASKLIKDSTIASTLAFLLNAILCSNEDRYFESFGADDIIPIKIAIENKAILKYWGRIYWLSTPADHACFRSYQDPFYGEFKLSNDSPEILKLFFGNYNQTTDLENENWVNMNIDWMYEL